LDAGLKAVFFIIALVLALVGAVIDWVRAESRPSVTAFLCAAFASFVVPFLGDALDAA
jgi:predicted membrane channel-forming protein YqfA (hemolysin III family)